MRKITDFDGLVTDRMVEFTELAPEQLRGKRIPMMCDEQERYKFSDLVDLTNGTTLHKDEKNKENTSYRTYDFNQLLEMGILKTWYPYTITELILRPAKDETTLRQIDNRMLYNMSADGILTSGKHGKDLSDLTDKEWKNLTSATSFLMLTRLSRGLTNTIPP